MSLEEVKLGGVEDELGGMSLSGRQAGVIAGLMGLETLPDVKWVPGLKSPDALSRSLSANFIDNLLELDLLSRRTQWHRHHRVRTLENKTTTTSDCWSSEENKDLKLSDEPMTRSWAGCKSESHRPNNARAAYEKKSSCSHPEVRGNDSTAVPAARILDPVIGHEKKATTKRKEEKEAKSSESGKQMDDAVNIEPGLTGADAGNSCRLSSGSSGRQEIFVMIKGARPRLPPGRIL